MSKTELIIKLFNNKYMRYLIPYINKKIINNKNNGNGSIELFYNKKDNLWYHLENGKTFLIDSIPYLNTHYNKLLKTLEEICCFKYSPKKGDVVIDIGAGAGSETVVFQRLIENGMVYAIEAHPETYKMLEQLCKINSYTNVKVCNVAISNETGSTLIDNKTNHVANSIMSKNSGIEIKTITMDEFIDENNIEIINFLKMNIEGAEELAVEGMTNTIKITENIAISCHDFLFDNSNYKIKNKIVNFLEKNDFEVSYSNSLHPVRQSWVYGKRKGIKT